ncbi:hypothetical protein PR048_030706 [Dryococelus australis]|uniref:HTH psq-type domain-containing protein n=1 Tax=Dryococelus australis TaxID=614101 RepID=A0ABQ9G9N2_9NEOP|nr:hypothetical protein PR048_030706 [Dryococelus australis]
MICRRRAPSEMVLLSSSKVELTFSDLTSVTKCTRSKLRSTIATRELRANALDADALRRNLLHPDWLPLIATRYRGTNLHGEFVFELASTSKSASRHRGIQHGGNDINGTRRQRSLTGGQRSEPRLEPIWCLVTILIRGRGGGGGHGGRAVILPASSQGRTRLHPRPSHVGIVADDAAGSEGFLVGFSVYTALSFRRRSMLASVTFIGSQGLAVNGTTRQLNGRQEPGILCVGDKIILPSSAAMLFVGWRRLRGSFRELPADSARTRRLLSHTCWPDKPMAARDPGDVRISVLLLAARGSEKRALRLIGYCLLRKVHYWLRCKLTILCASASHVRAIGTLDTRGSVTFMLYGLASVASKTPSNSSQTWRLNQGRVNVMRACSCRPYRFLTLDAQVHAPLKNRFQRETIVTRKLLSSLSFLKASAYLERFIVFKRLNERASDKGDNDARAQFPLTPKCEALCNVSLVLRAPMGPAIVAMLRVEHQPIRALTLATSVGNIARETDIGAGPRRRRRRIRRITFVCFIINKLAKSLGCQMAARSVATEHRSVMKTAEGSIATDSPKAALCIHTHTHTHTHNVFQLVHWTAPRAHWSCAASSYDPELAPSAVGFHSSGRRFALHGERTECNISFTGSQHGRKYLHEKLLSLYTITREMRVVLSLAHVYLADNAVFHSKRRGFQFPVQRQTALASGSHAGRKRLAVCSSRPVARREVPGRVTNGEAPARQISERMTEPDVLPSLFIPSITSYAQLDRRVAVFLQLGYNGEHPRTEDGVDRLFVFCTRGPTLTYPKGTQLSKTRGQQSAHFTTNSLYTEVKEAAYTSNSSCRGHRHWLTTCRKAVSQPAPALLIQNRDVNKTLSPATKAKRGSIPGRFAPDFRMWESCRTMPLVGGFPRGSPVPPPPPPFHSSAAPYSPRSLSSALDVESHPDLFTLITVDHVTLDSCVAQGALAAYRNGEMGLNECCRQYGITKPTLKRHLTVKTCPSASGFEILQPRRSELRHGETDRTCVVVSFVPTPAELARTTQWRNVGIQLRPRGAPHVLVLRSDWPGTRAGMEPATGNRTCPITKPGTKSARAKA